LKKFEAIILSGGKGTRIKKITKNIPKCLVDIYGKPFLYYQLKYLQKHKVNNVLLSIKYKSNLIDEYVKKNINFINVKLISDGKKSLGTGGAVINATNYLKKKFYIIYGDSYLNFDLNKLCLNKDISTMGILKNKNKYDKSNVILKDKNFVYYNKFNNNNNKYSFIDYGVSYVNKSFFSKYKKKVKIDLSSIFLEMSKKNLLKGYEIKKRFYEIGSYNGIREFKKFIKNEIY
jgi:D-glycero-alpha-D-manno-heptose 1-phosphate guanylyltransferase